MRHREGHGAGARGQVHVDRVLALAQAPHGLLGEELGGIARDEHAGLDEDLEVPVLGEPLDVRDGLALGAASDELVGTGAPSSPETLSPGSGS